MAEKVIPEQVIIQRIAAIDAQIAQLDTLRRQRVLLQELLDDAVEQDEDTRNPTLTESIIQAIRRNPGRKSSEVAQILVDSGLSANLRVIQTIIGQLVRREPPPIIRAADGNLFPPPEEEEGDDLPF